MFVIEVQLEKGKKYQLPPTEIIYRRLISQGLIAKGQTYKANYDCNDNKVIIKVDETQVNVADIALEAKGYSKLRTRFQGIYTDKEREELKNATS